MSTQKQLELKVVLTDQVSKEKNHKVVNLLKLSHPLALLENSLLLWTSFRETKKLIVLTS